MNAVTFANCANAALEDSVKAAEMFMRVVDESDKDIIVNLMNAAKWKDRQIMTFKHSSQAVLIEMKWGKFWFVPDKLVGITGQPSVGPSGLRALGIGLVRLLSKGG